MPRSAAAYLIPFAALLAGCQGGGADELAAAPTPTGDARVCNMLGAPTVVRYRSQDPERVEHAVHLLAGDPASARARGCAEAAPVASVVTLRYTVSGS